MRLYPRSLKWRTLLLTVWVLASVFGTVWYFHGRDIKRYVTRTAENFRLRNNSDPVVRALARGEFGPGSSIEELINRYPPKRVIRHGRFVDVHYHGPGVLARDGKLLYAEEGLNSIGHVYFDHMRTADCLAWRTSYAIELRRAKRESKDARFAVGGVAGLTSLPDWKSSEPDPDYDQP